jgi:hypothetical protein
MIDKLKAVLREYQDEPCTLQGVKCRDCKYRMYTDMFNDAGEAMKLCDALEDLSEVLEVV